MKTSVVLPVAGCLFLTSSLFADIVVPGADGTDGALAITENTVIDLGASGSYDPDEWAVVFRYTSVNIAAGATLGFTNHPRKAPVIWLVSGDVTINGTVNLGGAPGGAPPSLAEPGPGGFAGGMGQLNGTTKVSAGYGPGGGPLGYVSFAYHGVGGSYGTLGQAVNGVASRDPYGNASLVPLIGGSGGGGLGGGDNRIGGGGGGGAILIAATGTVTIEGSLRAIGGGSGNSAGGGSGGGIRIVANTIDGDGTVS
ncbi:MAG: hypothetical protein K9N23_11975, partial [Akkermansiaceae bacterium]|nr:hypothetical protein [Akkermansiaceae bacterium]